MNATRETNLTTHPHRRLAALLSAVALLAPLSIAGVAAAASAPPAPTAAQRAEALTAPSLVYVGVQWKGWVLMTEPIAIDGTLTMHGWQGPFVVNSSCSGFVADSTGNIVTAGHCVDNQSMTYGGKALILDALVAEVHRAFPVLTSAQLDILRTALEENARVEDRTSGSPPQRIVTVYPSGISSSTGQIANVVDFKGLSEGDVALLKVNAQTPLPLLPVAQSTPPIGTPIVLAGYAGSVSSVVDPGQAPSFKDGETSSQQTVNGVPFTEVSAAATAGMSGGPAVDMNGQVIGTVSFRPGGETAAFNFITATSTLRSLLSRNGVNNTLTAADRAYREGLTAYWAGRYHDAVKSFDKLLAIQPNHTRALLYKRLAIENYPNDVESGSSNTMLFVGIGVGVIVLLGIGAALLLRRRRKGGAPPSVEAPAAAPAPTPVTPVYAEPVVMTPPAPPAAVSPPIEVTPTEPVAVATSAPAPAEPAAPASGFCPKCGTPHAADAHFCEACGEHLKEVAAAGRGRWNGHG